MIIQDQFFSSSQYCNFSGLLFKKENLKIKCPSSNSPRTLNQLQGLGSWYWDQAWNTSSPKGSISESCENAGIWWKLFCDFHKSGHESQLLQLWSPMETKWQKSSCVSFLISIQSWCRDNKYMDQILPLWQWISEETPIIHICKIINTLGHTATISSGYKITVWSILFCAMQYVHFHEDGLLHWQISAHQNHTSVHCFSCTLNNIQGTILLFKRIQKLWFVTNLAS